MQIMSRHWMNNADRRSQDFIEGMHYFLGVAEANKGMVSYAVHVPYVRI